MATITQAMSTYRNELLALGIEKRPVCQYRGDRCRNNPKPDKDEVAGYAEPFNEVHCPRIVTVLLQQCLNPGIVSSPVRGKINAFPNASSVHRNG